MPSIVTNLQVSTKTPGSTPTTAAVAIPPATTTTTGTAELSSERRIGVSPVTPITHRVSNNNNTLKRRVQSTNTPKTPLIVVIPPQQYSSTSTTPLDHHHQQITPLSSSNTSSRHQLQHQQLQKARAFPPFDQFIQTHTRVSSGLKINTKSSTACTPAPDASSSVEEQLGSEVVLCDDVICHISSYLDLNSALNFRSVNTQSCAILTNNSTYWQSLSSKKFDKELNPKGAFREFLLLSKMLLDTNARYMRNARRLNIIEPWQKIIRVIYGAICPALFAIGLVLIAVVWPLIKDKTFPATASNLQLFFIPVVLLILLPYLVMIAGISLDTLCINTWKSRIIASGLPEGVTKETSFIEKNHVRDMRASHIGLLFVWSLFGVPMQITAFYIHYMVGLNTRTSIFCIPQYLFTLLFIFVPIFNYMALHREMNRDLEFREQHRIFGLLGFVHFLGIVFNLIMSVQIGLICAKIDGMMTSSSWLPLFAPVWSLTAILLFSVITYSVVIWSTRNPKRSISSIGVFLVILLLLSALLFITSGTCLVGLRLDEVVSTAYFITAIPIFFAFMIFLPVTCLTGIICSLHTCTKTYRIDF